MAGTVKIKKILSYDVPQTGSITHIKHMKSNLTFNALREANIARLPHFKNKKGKKAHSKKDGSDWIPAQWLQAVAGELGEYANLRKKYERGDITKKEFDVEARKELADITCYLDILAFQLKIDLGEAVREKFNEVSKRINVPITIGDNNEILNFIKTAAQKKAEKTLNKLNWI